MTQRSYKVVDAFSSRPFLGNPVAVVLDAEGLNTEEMLAIAKWTNLSETTFVLPPTTKDADYRLRIFTLSGELPFAGHPTLGSAHALLEAGRVTPRNGSLVQECQVGLVPLRVEGERKDRRIHLSLPEAKVTPLQASEIAELEAILGQPVEADAVPSIINVGAIWIVAKLADAARVLSLKPDFARSGEFERRLGANGVTVFGAHETGEADIEVRSFARSCGVDEDPVCGSGNGSVAVFHRERGLIPASGASYTAAQGQCVGRNGRIAVQVGPDGKVSVGGACVTCVDGVLTT